MLSQNFGFVTACTGEAVGPGHGLGSVLVFGSKSFDSLPLVSRGARLFRGESILDPAFFILESGFSNFVSESFKAWGGVTGVICERRSRVFSLI